MLMLVSIAAKIKQIGNSTFQLKKASVVNAAARQTTSTTSEKADTTIAQSIFLSVFLHSDMFDYDNR